MKKARRFPLVTMEGSHYAMGRQYGAQCKDRIHDLVAKFDDIILHGMDAAEARRIAREAVPHVEAAAPELIEEVQGIADGAESSFDDIFRLNCSVELFSWRGCVEQQTANTVPPPPDGCSSFALKTATGTLVAWNMDWWRLWLPYIVLLHGKPDDGPRFFAFAFVGCVGRPGMSEHVAVAANYLPYRGGAAPGRPNAWDGPGVPYNFLVRIMLKQRSTREAIQAARAVKRMACLNYTIGDPSGDFCCLETTPREVAELRPEGDFITHANSYLTAEFDGIPPAALAERDQRTHSAREQLRRCPRPFDRQQLAAVQRSHFPGADTGVCVHRKLQDKDGITLLSFAADPAAGTMWAAYGPPCEHEFVAYTL